MGSGSSNQSKEQAQSTPTTARTTPKPRRNQQFQEVQLGPGGTTPKSRPTGKTQGPSPNTNPHQSTSNQGRTPRGQDPGASGGQSERSSRQQQPQPRQGAAANGRQRQTAMPSQQDKPQRISFEELTKNSADAQGNVPGSEPGKGDNPGNAAANGSVSSTPGAHNSDAPVTSAQMVNGVASSKPDSTTNGHVTSTIDNKTKKKKNTVILVTPSKPIPSPDKKLDLREIANKKDIDKRKEVVNDNQDGKTGIMQRGKIFRPNVKDVKDDNDDGKVSNKKDARSSDNRIENTQQQVADNTENADGQTHTKAEKNMASKKGHMQNVNDSRLDQNDMTEDKTRSVASRGKKVSFAPMEEKEPPVAEKGNGMDKNVKDQAKTDKEAINEQLKNEQTKKENAGASSEEEIRQRNNESKGKVTRTSEKNIEGKPVAGGSKQPMSNLEEAQFSDKNDTDRGKKKLMDEKGYLNLAALDKVTDQIQKLQEAKTDDQLSQLSYDDFYGNDAGSIGNASDLSHDPEVGGQEREVGASQADQKEPDVLSMKEDDIVFETFYHRSGKEFQCIYQSGMRFYLDDWGSKEWQPFPKRWYNEGLLVTNTILRDDGSEQNRNDQTGAAGQGTSRSSQGRSQGQGGGGGNDDREGFIIHPTKGRIPTYIFYKKHNVHMYFDKENGSWVRLPIGWELHHDMVKSLVDQVEVNKYIVHGKPEGPISSYTEAVPDWGDRHDILALLRACNYDPDECISIYLHLKGDEWLKAPKTSKEAKGMADKDTKIQDLEKKVRDLEIQLQKERQTREELERNLEESDVKMSEIEAESKQTEAQMSAMTGGRPKSARPVSVMMLAGKGKGGKGGKQGKLAGEMVNPEDVYDLNANAKELRKAHTKLRMEVERYFGDFKHIIGQVGPTIKKLKQSEKGTAAEIEEVRALYRKEALQRKLLYNQLQELRGNIRVFCRVRKDDKAENCLKYPSDQDLVATNQSGKKMFSFDKVFEPSSSQEQVFEDTKPIISSCADGYNVCLLAYGQTGSGKTFTMMGPESNPGINIRAMKELFQVCKERAETMSYSLTVSLVEIYNETIQDLLTSDAKTLELRTAGNKVNIPGIIEYPIKNVDDVKKVMAMGDKNRSVASTKMNSTSSRSHLVLMLAVEGKDKVTNAVSRGTLVLCDLAGSERISKTEAEGQRLVEAAAINKSLSALGQVFTALRTSQLHVPYRNSKLTQILQPSLGGDAKACLFVNVSPDSYNFLETVSTLTFGSNARQVALGQAKQNISKGKG